MLLTILGVIALIIGIIIVAITKDCWDDGWFIVGVIDCIIAGVTVGVCILCICFAQIPKEKNYQQMVYEKEVIEYRIENQDKDIVGNELLYQDVVEYNRKLRNIKTYSKNIWVNWFYNDKIADIDYIEYKR